MIKLCPLETLPKTMPKKLIMFLSTLKRNILIFRKEDAYEKKWRTYADFQLTIKI